MTSILVEWENKPFALLIESDKGDYLVPPIVLDEDSNVVEGQEVLMAIVASGVGVKMPIIRGATPGILAEVDRRMSYISQSLGVPTWEQRASSQDAIDGETSDGSLPPEADG